MEQCRMCGHRLLAGSEQRCSFCQIMQDKITLLPPFPIQVPPVCSKPNYLKQLDPVDLKKEHPQKPYMPQINPGEFKHVQGMKDINYHDVLDENTAIAFWCVERENAAGLGEMFVRAWHKETTEDNWLTIGGLTTDAGRLLPGDLLTIGQYPWIFHAQAKGHGYRLEPAKPVDGATLELKQITVGKRLNIENIKIEAGQFVAVIGSSGSGKSTLIREIAGRRVGRGEVLINGKLRTKHADPAVTEIAYVPQQDIVHEDLTIRQQVEDYARLVKPDVSEDLIQESLNIVGLRDKDRSFPCELSGGQLRRSRLAAAFARRAGLLVLDEPDSGLDPDTAMDVRRLLRTLSLLGTTVVMITHHHSNLGLFDRVIELDNGKIKSFRDNQAVWPSAAHKQDPPDDTYATLQIVTPSSGEGPTNE